MANILITGGAGFIGYFLGERLSRSSDHRVTILDNLSRGRLDEPMQQLVERDNVELVSGDLTDPRLLLSLPADYEYIYHLAAIIGVRNVLEHPDRVLHVNSSTVLNILEFARGLESLKRFVFSSTSEVYAGTLEHFGMDIPTPETTPLAIHDVRAERTTYGLSKMFGESAVFSYRSKYDVPVAVVRYHNVYGPRMGFQHVIPEMFIKIRDNEEVEVMSPDHTRAFCYADDAIEATIRVAEAEATEGTIINIGNDTEEIRVEDLVQRIARSMGRDIATKRLPSTPGSPARRCPDIAKLTELTGFVPQIQLDEGIAKTYKWYKDKLHDRYE